MGELRALQRFARPDGLRCTFHVSTGRDPRTARGQGGAVINYAVHSLAPTMEPLVNTCASGVAERHPKLRFGAVGAGIGWVAWMLDASGAACHPRRQQPFLRGILRIAHHGMDDLRPLLTDEALEWADKVELDPYPPDRYVADLQLASRGAAIPTSPARWSSAPTTPTRPTPSLPAAPCGPPTRDGTHARSLRRRRVERGHRAPPRQPGP